MILGFSTQLNGKPTYFVEKIHVGIKIENKVGLSSVDVTPNYNFFVKSKCKPKTHTIREDIKDRWKVGMKIDFFINVRKKDMFRFAPVLPVVSIQNFQIVWYDTTDTVWEFPHLKYAVRIDKRRLEPSEIEILAQNDGFVSVEDFLNYFNKDFKGKIIHWTDLKY